MAPKTEHRWRQECRRGPGNAFSGHGKPRWSEGRIAEWERKIGRQTLEIDFLKGCLQRIEEQRMLQGMKWKSAVYRKVQEEVKAQRGLTIERMVKLGRVSRSDFYRFAEDRPPAPNRDLDLRDSLQRIALEWPSYARRRITAELRRRGWRVNPKRVYRLMREDNLLCVRKRKFIVTTDSRHGRKVYVLTFCVTPGDHRGATLPGKDAQDAGLHR